MKNQMPRLKKKKKNYSLLVPPLLRGFTLQQFLSDYQVDQVWGLFI